MTFSAPPRSFWHMKNALPMMQWAGNSSLALFTQTLSSGVAGHGFTKENTKMWEGRMKPKTRFSLAQENEIQTFNMRRRVSWNLLQTLFWEVSWSNDSCGMSHLPWQGNEIQNFNMGPSSMYNLLPRERGGLALKYHDSICWMLPPRIGTCKAQGMIPDRHSYD